MSLSFPDSWQHRWHPRVVTHIDFTNDGTLMAVALAAGDTSCPAIEVYKTADGSRVAAFGTGMDLGRGVAFAEAGQGQTLYCLVEAPDLTKRLLRVPLTGGDPEQIASYGAGEFIDTLHRDRDGRFLAVAGFALEVWDLSRREVFRYKTAAEGPAQQVRACFSPEGAHLYLYGTVPGEVIVLDVAADAEVKRWPAPKPFGEQVILSPTGRYLAVVGLGKGMYIYDTETEDRVYPTFYTDTSPAALQAFSFDGTLLVEQSGMLRLPSLELAATPPAKPGRAIAMASAWDAPVFAFSNRKGDFFWARLIETAA